MLLGTFHAKFLIVDRKVALINSNNIQGELQLERARLTADRPNLELMSHLEGPIVDSFYEVALHSWYNKLSPPLPCMAKPYQPPVDKYGNTRYLFQDHNPYCDDIEILKAAKAARLLLREQTKDADAERALSDEHGLDRFRDAVYKAMDKQRQSLADWKPGEELNKRAENAMHELREFRERWGLGGSRAPSRSGSRAPSRRASFEVGGRKDRKCSVRCGGEGLRRQNSTRRRMRSRRRMQRPARRPIRPRRPAPLRSLAIRQSRRILTRFRRVV